MYRLGLLVTLLFVANLVIGQVSPSEDTSKTANQIFSYVVFGEKIELQNTISSKKMYQEYTKLNTTDSLNRKFSAKVLAVCKAKGCWMRLALANGEETMVKFKDYGFFMPLDITGNEVIVNENAFVNEMSVAEQQHYAEDAGKSKEEIAKIITPKKTYGFIADGVLLKK